MEFIDTTGKPRSDQEIKEAIEAIKREMVMGEPKPIMIFYTTIINGLEELIQRRNVMNHS